MRVGAGIQASGEGRCARRKRSGSCGNIFARKTARTTPTTGSWRLKPAALHASADTVHYLSIRSARNERRDYLRLPGGVSCRCGGRAGSPYGNGISPDPLSREPSWNAYGTPRVEGASSTSLVLLGRVPGGRADRLLRLGQPGPRPPGSAPWGREGDLSAPAWGK
jgi:hypothetical protein